MDELFDVATFALSEEDITLLNDKVKELKSSVDDEYYIEEEDGEEEEDDEKVHDVPPIHQEEESQEEDLSHFVYDPPTSYKNIVLLYTIPILLIVSLYTWIHFNTPDTLLINELQNQIETLSSKVAQLEHIQQNIVKETTTVVVSSEVRSDIKTDVKSDIEFELTSAIEITTTPPPPPPPPQVVHTYTNIARQCRVSRQLTSYPVRKYRPQHRKSTISRILHGFPDTLRRFYYTGTFLKTPFIEPIDNIDLFSPNNSPSNVLHDTGFWQCYNDGNIYFTIDTPPIIISEIGIYYGIRNDNDNDNERWNKAMVKDIEILIKPVNSTILSIPKVQNIGPINNKQRNDPLLQSWISLGSFEYQPSDDMMYQSFHFDKDISAVVGATAVEGVMLVIKSNWGDAYTVLDTLRIYTVV